MVLLPPAIIAPWGSYCCSWYRSSVELGSYLYWAWVIGFGYGCAGDVSMSYLMDSYPNAVIETMTVVAVINNCIGCVFTFACSPFINALGNTKTFIILAVIEFVIMASACFFIYYGKRIRIWTKTGT